MKGTTGCRVTAIVLAAGQSRRFGDRNKLLTNSKGKPIIQRTLENLFASDIDNTLVVTGHQANIVESLCQTIADRHKHKIAFIHNRDFNAGMSTSLKSAITHLINNEGILTDNVQDNFAVLVTLADMPDVSTNTYNTLITATKQAEQEKSTLTESTQTLVFAPTFKGHRGNPIIIKPEIFDMILDIDGDVGARHLLKEHQAIVQDVPVEDAGILIDIDTQADLQQNESDLDL